MILPSKSAIIRILVYECPKIQQQIESSVSRERLCIVIATATQLFLFVGGPKIEHTFSSSTNSGKSLSIIDNINTRILSNLVFECPKDSPFTELHATLLYQDPSSIKRSVEDDRFPGSVLLWWLTGYDNPS